MPLTGFSKRPPRNRVSTTRRRRPACPATMSRPCRRTRFSRRTTRSAGALYPPSIKTGCLLTPPACFPRLGAGPEPVCDARGLCHLLRDAADAAARLVPPDGLPRVSYTARAFLSIGHLTVACFPQHGVGAEAAAGEDHVSGHVRPGRGGGGRAAAHAAAVVPRRVRRCLSSRRLPRHYWVVCRLLAFGAGHGGCRAGWLTASSSRASSSARRPRASVCTPSS